MALPLLFPALLGAALAATSGEVAGTEVSRWEAERPDPLEQAEILQVQGDFSGAEALYREAIASRPGDWNVAERLAELHLYYTHDLDAARDVLTPWAHTAEGRRRLEELATFQSLKPGPAETAEVRRTAERAVADWGGGLAIAQCPETEGSAELEQMEMVYQQSLHLLEVQRWDLVPDLLAFHDWMRPTLDGLVARCLPAPT
jgi:hypothetical protein